MTKMILSILAVLTGIYLFICLLLFFAQENFIFFPQKLSKDFRFNFDQRFEELAIRTKDNQLLNALLFKSDSSKGVIFYLHGNAGSLKSWAEVAVTYTNIGYDLFIMDYRGFGKSESTITSEKQFFADIQTAYDELKKRYAEDKIVVLGYSIGTAAAAKIASDNNPRLLILQAPYYSLTDMMQNLYPLIPAFVLKYKFDTYKYIAKCKAPVVIFHGKQDEVIYYGSSLKLKQLFKKQDTLIMLEGQRHNGITENEDYKMAIRDILN